MTKSATANTPVEVSIDDFDEVSEQEAGVEIELTRANGRATGIYLTVIGEGSDRVQSHIFRTINTRRRQDQINLRKKGAEARPIEDDVQLTLDKAVLCVTAWRGPKEEFNTANVTRLLKKNPTFAAQVLETAADTAGFTKS